MHRLRNMVDDGETRAGWGLTGGVELNVPDLAERTCLVGEINQAAAEPPNRRNFQLAWSDGLLEWLIEQPTRASQRGGGIVNSQTDGACRGAVRDVVGVGETFLLGVGDEIDAALRPSRHRLRFMGAAACETQPSHERAEAGLARLVQSEFDELGAQTARARR